MSDSQEVILNRMLNDIDSSYNKTKGEFVYDILSAAAKEFEKAYSSNEDEIRKKHIDSANGKELEELVKEYANTQRKNATYSSGIVKITADVGATFYKDDLVSIGSINYKCNESVTADSSGIIEAGVTCSILGSSGNTEANTIIYFPKTLSGLKSVTNPKAFANGYDEETDEELRERYYEKVGDPETSGNISQYRAWAKSITGVGDTKVLECWNGPGTIKIVIIDSNRGTASEELIKEVHDYILSVRPACSGTLTVESATIKNININVTLQVDTTNYSDEEIKSDVENNIRSYFKKISFEEGTVAYFIVADSIINSNGVKNISNLLINNEKSDIQISNTEIAVLGTIIYG